MTTAQIQYADTNLHIYIQPNSYIERHTYIVRRSNIGISRVIGTIADTLTDRAIDTEHEVPIASGNSTVSAKKATPNLSRDEAIAQLQAAGISIADIYVPQEARELTSKERSALGTVPKGSPSILEIVNADRY